MALIWNTVKTTPNRWMAWWLRRQGWVCFYLEPQARACLAARGHPEIECWMALYERDIARMK